MQTAGDRGTSRRDQEEKDEWIYRKSHGGWKKRA